MRSLVLEVTLQTPDGNPWPLVTIREVIDDQDQTIVICEAVRVPALGRRLDEVLARVFRLWHSFGPIAVAEFLEAVWATKVPPRRS